MSVNSVMRGGRGEMDPGDLALMLSVWPELSERERELQAPLLSSAPGALMAWMTAGCRRWGMGPEGLARRARERDRAWRANHEKWPGEGPARSDSAALGSALWRRRLWGRVAARWLNPFAACVSGGFYTPALCSLTGASFAFVVGGIWCAPLFWDGFHWGAVAIGGAGWLARRGWWISRCWGGYQRDSALPARVAAWRWLAARREGAREREALRSEFPEAFGASGVSALLLGLASGQGPDPMARIEESRRASFERARDLDEARARMERFEMSQALPAARAGSEPKRSTRL